MKGLKTWETLAKLIVVMIVTLTRSPFLLRLLQTRSMSVKRKQCTSNLPPVPSLICDNHEEEDDDYSDDDDNDNDIMVGWFLLRQFDFFNFYMVSSCSILFTDFGTVFVFALGWFFTPSVNFYYLRGNLHWDDLKWPKNHFRVVKRWFWVVECKFWGHISIEKCFRFFRLGTGSAIFKGQKIA